MYINGTGQNTYEFYIQLNRYDVKLVKEKLIPFRNWRSFVVTQNTSTSYSSSLHRCGTLGGSDHHKREVKNRNPTVSWIILHFIMLILCNTNNVHILSMCHPRCAIMNGLMLPPVQCWCCNQYWLLLEYLLHIFVINYLRAVIWPPLALVLITPLPCVNNDYPTL